MLRCRCARASHAGRWTSEWSHTFSEFYQELHMSILRKIKRRGWWKLWRSTRSFEKSVAPLVSIQANKIIDIHNNRESGKAMFIDMGSNLGKGFRFFSEHYNPNLFDYLFIEPNPFCIDQLRMNISKLYSIHSWDGDWEIMNVAVSNKDGTLRLYGLVEDDRGKTSEGASVIREHNSVFYNSNVDEAITVRSIKASRMIENASKKYSTIIVKMDIEASEYDVLEDLIATEIIDKINHLYVEWHSNYYSADKIGDIRIRENRIKASLSGKLTDWH